MKDSISSDGKKAAFQLSGLIYGISLDGVVNSKEYQALKDWCVEYEPLCEHVAFEKLYQDIKPIIDDGKINSEELEQIKEILTIFLTKLGLQRETSSNLYFLSGLFQGILASGDVNTYEIYKLNQWLEKNSNLQSQSPFDELFEMIESVLEDKKVEDAEAKLLKEFFSKHML